MPESTDRGTSSQINILLVDDTPAKLLTYEAALAELGQNLLKAHSVQEAAAVLLNTDVALILTDVFMPGGSGFDLAKMVREHPRFSRTPIVFISAEAHADVDDLRAYATGVVDYMTVPVTPELLRAKVRIFIELFAKERELAKLKNELEAQQLVLNRELQHRTRNLLAVVQSIVTSTLERSQSTASARDAIVGRLHALGRAQEFVASGVGGGVPLRALVEGELTPFAAQVSVEGELIVLGGAFAQQFALLLHELATNAAKHGSLSSASGKVFVSWETRAQVEPTLVLSWRECDGPPIKASTEQGLGMSLIRALLPSQPRLSFAESGLEVTLELPLSDVMSATE